MDYKRIDKRAARKLFNEKKPVLIIPHKCAPGGVWFTGIEMENDGSRTFDEFCNEFIYYNCNSQTGKYPAFYVEEGSARR